MLQKNQGKGEGTRNSGDCLYSRHPHNNYTSDEGITQWDQGKHTPYCAAFSYPFSAFVVSANSSDTTPIPTKPILAYDTITYLTGENEIEWKTKVYQAYETIHKYHNSVRPGEPLS
jgi:hypothetical protein